MKDKESCWLDKHHKGIPLIPPPRTLHISVKAACSRLLFSALGTPSDGVISPTIAIKVQNYYQMQKPQIYRK